MRALSQPFFIEARHEPPTMRAATTVVGIDVGGRRKGFHAVALRDGRLRDQLTSTAPEVLADGCLSINAVTVGISAPCRWNLNGRPRSCERKLMQAGMRCFATPSRDRALSHPSRYYAWMMMVEALYSASAPSHPLSEVGPVSLETFPHAITRLNDPSVSREYPDKRARRLGVLDQLGMDGQRFTRSDWIDAALCALAAHHPAIRQSCRVFASAADGLVVIPQIPGLESHG